MEGFVIKENMNMRNEKSEDDEQNSQPAINQEMEGCPGSFQVGRDIVLGAYPVPTTPQKKYRITVISATIAMGIFTAVVAGVILHFLFSTSQKNTSVLPVKSIVDRAIPEKQNFLKKEEEEDTMAKNDHDQAPNQYMSNSPGSIQAGRDINVNIHGDKESLGRGPLGIYRDGKRIGTAINPTISEKNGTITMDKIRFDKPVEGFSIDLAYYDGPYEFRNFKIIVKYKGMITLIDPSLIGVSGRIIDTLPNVKLRPEE